MYSASKVDGKILVWIFDTQFNGHTPKVITHTLFDFIYTESYVFFMFPKSWRICIHIAFQIHITIRVKYKAFLLFYNQVASYPLYWLIMTPPWNVGESITLVHYNLDIWIVVSGEINQHYHSISIIPRFIKSISKRLCHQWHCFCWSDLIITI